MCLHTCSFLTLALELHVTECLPRKASKDISLAKFGSPADVKRWDDFLERHLKLSRSLCHLGGLSFIGVSGVALQRPLQISDLVDLTSVVAKLSNFCSTYAELLTCRSCVLDEVACNDFWSVWSPVRALACNGIDYMMKSTAESLKLLPDFCVALQLTMAFLTCNVEQDPSKLLVLVAGNKTKRTKLVQAITEDKLKDLTERFDRMLPVIALVPERANLVLADFFEEFSAAWPNYLDLLPFIPTITGVMLALCNADLTCGEAMKSHSTHDLASGRLAFESCISSLVERCNSFQQQLVAYRPFTAVSNEESCYQLKGKLSEKLEVTSAYKGTVLFPMLKTFFSAKVNSIIGEMEASLAFLNGKTLQADGWVFADKAQFENPDYVVDVEAWKKSGTSRWRSEA